MKAVMRMKPPKKEVLTAIRDILKVKKLYSLQDIVNYCAAKDIKTTRRDVMLVIVEIIRESKIHE